MPYCAPAWPCSTTTRCSACHRPRRRPCCWSRYPLFGGGGRRRICFSSRFPEYLNHPRGAAALAPRKRSLVWINLNFFRGCRPTYFSARLFFINCRRRCLQAFDKATLKFFFQASDYSYRRRDRYFFGQLCKVAARSSFLFRIVGCSFAPMWV